VTTQVVRITHAVAAEVAQQVKLKIAMATVAQRLGLRMDIVMMVPTNGMVLQFS
jgi:hypothetical protein